MGRCANARVGTTAHAQGGNGGALKLMRISCIYARDAHEWLSAPHNGLLLPAQHTRERAMNSSRVRPSGVCDERKL